MKGVFIEKSEGKVLLNKKYAHQENRRKKRTTVMFCGSQKP
jgi:hypothetical protein